MTPPTNIQTRIRRHVESLDDDYYWTGKDGKQCSYLLPKINFIFRNRNSRTPTNDELYNVFVLIWHEKPDWIDTVPVLNKYFNETIASIKKRFQRRIGDPIPEVGW